MKPTTVKGTRDFGPGQVQRRNYIFNTIRNTFELFGYQPIETPAMENMSTLSGKYGDEGEQLLFKILNSGDYLAKADSKAIAEKDSKSLSKHIAEKGLRYDLTIPFARYVVQHQHEINFPFRRYQIQPVWRADRPQKGRYREFYQCDADIVGSQSPLNELELMQIYDKAFTELRIPVKIRYNHRKVLEALAELLGIKDRFPEFTTILDKLDKIGKDGVSAELKKKEFPSEVVEKWHKYFFIELHEKDFIEFLAVEFTARGMEDPMQEVRILRALMEIAGITNQVSFDISLARGLSYYTGFVFEVIDESGEFGSLGGGGRYDDLTGLFGLKDVSGVGISFGADRIYDVLEKNNAFPESELQNKPVLLVNFETTFYPDLIQIAEKLRKNGIPAEIYPSPEKMKKQFKYADQKNLKFILVAGSEEIQKNRYGLKNLESGTQELLTIEQIIEEIKLSN